MPVALGGGQRGDVILPQSLVPTIASVPAWVESPIVRAISSYRTILFYVEVETLGGLPGQVQLRINWYRDEGATGIPYEAVRRDASQNIVPDEPTLPSALGVQRFAVPVANPGGATGVSIGYKSLAQTPNIQIHWSAES